MIKDLHFFLKHTKPNGDCLEWTRCYNTDGYPRTVWNNSSNGKVHRIVWELANNESATSKVVRHLCNNPRCINPNHLSIGTTTDNMLDRDLAGRHGASKITPKDVNTICLLYSTKKYTQKEIGILFGINSRTVSSVIKGTHWKHVQRTPLVGGL